MKKINRREFFFTGTKGIAGVSLFGLELMNPRKEIMAQSTGKEISMILETPKLMNMGFHYTEQYSRRTRYNVLGMVEQSSEEWVRWYKKMHEIEALKKMADAGYEIIEIHFMYGYGIKGEKVEYDLTKKMVENAHKVGIRVLGYLQFYSVEKELFYVENPWAKKYPQLDENGKQRAYSYDRPVLCFNHKQVQDYYLEAVEVGLEYCDLDGIRLDNDWFSGCYCDKCQEDFRKYLKKKYTSPEKAHKVFGYDQFDEMELVPKNLSASGVTKDPLFLEMVKFRMLQRQEMMKLIKNKVKSIKSGAILGGNPGICRGHNDSSNGNLYIPDLGETHDLVCAENLFFPARTGDSVRHQIIAYKHGQANDFKIFPSHHLLTKEGKTRWPENKEECALTLCEALAFGGHVPCTTWGIRMDGSEGKTLYERPYFMNALTPIKDFLQQHGNIYKNAISEAEVGIYMNRETHICDAGSYWYSLQGIIQLLIREKIPFKLVDTDEDDKLSNLKLLLVGNVRLVSDGQLERFKKFSEKNKIIATGESLYYDEYYLKRDRNILDEFYANRNVVHLKDCPEAILKRDVTLLGLGYSFIPLPPDGDKFIQVLKKVYQKPIHVSSSPFIAVDLFKNDKNEFFLHVLNYDNASPQDALIQFDKKMNIQVFSPQNIGSSNFNSYTKDENTFIELKNLHTYTVIKALKV